MDDNPLRRKAAASKPKIWAEGSQKPPFVFRAFAAAALHYARDGVGALFGILARGTAGFAAKVAGGACRLPADRLGRAEAIVPSHVRVAGWIMATADILTRAGFIAHSDPVKAARLRASVPPLDWSLHLPEAKAGPSPETPPDAAADAASETPPQPAQPDAMALVALQEPIPPAEDDPLAAIRSELAGAPPALPTPPATPRASRPRPAQQPPKAPGPRSALADGLIDAAGFALGWAAAIVALPYGLIRAGYAHIKGDDLRKLSEPD